MIEAHPHGIGPGTAEYRNNCILFVMVKDGLLHTVREYFDPFEVLAYVEAAEAAG